MNSTHIRAFISPQSFTLVLLAMLLVLPAFASQFQQGDEIKLTREEALYFRERVFRTGQKDETFTVLAYRPDQKKIFVKAEDANGKEIALSVAEEAVALIPADTAELQQRAIEAATAGKFDEASQLIARVIKSNPENLDLVTTQKSITALAESQAARARARQAAATASAEAARRKKNADIIPVSRDKVTGKDNNAARRNAERAEAAKMEASAQETVQNAEAAYKSALAALAGKPGMNQGVTGTTALTDQFVEPEGLIPIEGPTYAETIEFINSKISGGVFVMGFGKSTQKMIYRTTTKTSPGKATTFDPKDLDASVHYESGPIEGPYSLRHIVLKGRKGTRTFTLYRASAKGSGGNNAPSDSLTIPVTNSVDPKRVAEAFSHLIQMFGGKAEAF